MVIQCVTSDSVVIVFPSVKRVSSTALLCPPKFQSQQQIKSFLIIQ